jgi:DNA invertase Pin-like site-specific DNA recombinase
MRPLSLTEGEIDEADAAELRVAYRELLAENQALRKLISERTSAAVSDLREKGLKFNGNLPYGLEADDETKKLKASRYEKRLIAEITQLKAEGRSLRDIARTLTERHFVNRKGKPIDAKQVSRILAASDE